MKKYIAFVLVSVLVFGLAGCQNKTYEAPWDQFCFTVDSPSEVVLSGEDKSFILDLMNGTIWIDDMTNCGCDYVFHTKKQEVRYHSECGTFVDYTSKRCTMLTEEQKNAVNAILRVDAGENSTAVLPLSAKSVKAIVVSTLPESEDFIRVIFSQDANEKIINYINGMHLKSHFSEDPNRYDGMTVVMDFQSEDGSSVTVYSFGNMFLKVGDKPWLRMEYEEATELMQMVLSLEGRGQFSQTPYSIPYVENEDGTFLCDGITYQYRIEKKLFYGSGIQRESISVYLSNTEELPPEFSPNEAVLVEQRTIISK